jgi:hypothetical protein
MVTAPVVWGTYSMHRPSVTPDSLTNAAILDVMSINSVRDDVFTERIMETSNKWFQNKKGPAAVQGLLKIENSVTIV